MKTRSISRTRSSGHRNSTHHPQNRWKGWIPIALTAVIALIIVGAAVFRAGAGVPEESTAASSSVLLPLSQAGRPLRGGHDPSLIPRVTPTARSVPAGQPAPRLDLPSQEFNFGRVSRDTVVTHVFPVNNLGTADLHITTLVTSCGCTTAELSSDTIPPGQRADLKVVFDADFHPVKGSVTRLVWLGTDDPAHPWVEIRLEGYVE